MLNLLLASGKSCISLAKAINKKNYRIDHFTAGTIYEDDYELVCSILKQPDSWLFGEEIKEYENQFASYLGAKKSYSFFGGRVALSAILEAFDIGKGDEVILPAYTCVVVPNAIRYRGSIPVYADIELDTLGPDVKEISKKITSKTKAIIIHHLFGLVCRDFEKIIDLAVSKGIVLIEDCAHATGAGFKGKKVGTFGDAAFFSTEQSKVFSTRMGGLAVSRHKNIDDKLEEIQSKASMPDKALIYILLKDLTWKYREHFKNYSWWLSPIMHELGKKYNWQSTNELESNAIKPEDYGLRLPNALAALGIKQLEKLDNVNGQRRREAENWHIWAIENGYKPLKVIPQSEPIFLRYPLLVESDRKSDLKWGRKLGAEVGVWFTSMEHPRKVICEHKNACKVIESCVNFPTIRRVSKKLINKI